METAIKFAKVRGLLNTDSGVCIERMCRVGQDHIYTVCIRSFWQGNHRIYSHVRCINTVMANPMLVAQAFGRSSVEGMCVAPAFGRSSVVCICMWDKHWGGAA